MPFPYESYKTLTEQLTIYYPPGESTRARWIVQTIDKARHILAGLLDTGMPELEILLVSPRDWDSAPHNELEELNNTHPFWTDATSPPCLVVPLELDPIFGTPTLEQIAFMLYHELSLAFLEADPRPYPNEYPLWADEWQLKFAALWLSQQISPASKESRKDHQGMVNTELREKYAEIFEPEQDGKTPITIRSFDWYEDTTPEDYLCYELLLEQLAADLLSNYGPEVLPRFLALYRKEHDVLLSDVVTDMLGMALGIGGTAWLDELVYF